ncbi:cytochrome P450 [Streptomyces sp. NPDC006208]|uniref:cytochrome P450 n=1 Tax=Streptomyces sp. NPDC006208 TaxID=3156734 RepID=UPI0033B5D2F0
MQNIYLLLMAGHETTINLITSTVHALLENSEKLATVLDGSHSWSKVIVESLSCASPVRYGLMRYATQTEDRDGIDVLETKIIPGEAVIVGHYASGRDPEIHEHSERLDLNRCSHQHLAFGYGAHCCLGAALGELEAEVVVGQLFARFPDVILATTDAIPTVGSILLYGLQRLPASLRAGVQTGVKEVAIRA